MGSGCSDLLQAVPPLFKQYHPTPKQQNQYLHLLESKLGQMHLSFDSSSDTIHVFSVRLRVECVISLVLRSLSRRSDIKTEWVLAHGVSKKAFLPPFSQLLA